MKGGSPLNPLAALLAQSIGAHPFEVSVALAPSKRRRALLREEAIRQDELLRLVKERRLRPGAFWSPREGSRLAREWNDVKRQLAREGVIDAA